MKKHSHNFQFYLVSIILFIIGVIGCNQQLQKRICQAEDIITVPSSYDAPTNPQFPKHLQRRGGACYDSEHYIPDPALLTASPVKYVRMNIHFINSTSGKHNFSPDKGIEYAEQLVATANKDLANNKKMRLPQSNNTPVLPTRYRYVLTPTTNKSSDKGIYFHKVADPFYIHKGKNKNLGDRTIINKYANYPDSILNVFIMPHHPDSMRSKTYSKGGVGVMVGTAIKMAGLYESGKPAWQFRSILNHEVGHIYSLRHTWAYNDGCDDTPKNPNCWNTDVSEQCKELTSNNLMDYNAYQHAWTPCQIGKIQQRMANLSSPSRKFLIEKWCDLNENQNVVIRDSVHWKGAKDLEGHLILDRNATLKIDCRVNIPSNGKIIVAPGATLILGENSRLHNDCGKYWEGIEIQQQGKQKGQVMIYGTPKIENMKAALPN